MIARIQTFGELWAGIGGGILLCSLWFGGVDFHELRTFTDVSTDQAERVPGVLIADYKRLRIFGNAGTLFSCPIGWCGYPGMNADLGKARVFWLTDGRIIQVERDGLKVDVRALQLKRKTNTVLWCIGGLAVSLVLFLVGYRYRGRPIKAVAVSVR